MTTYYARINGSAHPHGPPCEAEMFPQASWWHGKYCFWSTFPHQPYEIAERDGRDDEAEQLLAAYNVGVALAIFRQPAITDSDFVDERGYYDIYARDRVRGGDMRWPPRALAKTG